MESGVKEMQRERGSLAASGPGVRHPEFKPGCPGLEVLGVKKTCLRASVKMNWGPFDTKEVHLDRYKSLLTSLPASALALAVFPTQEPGAGVILSGSKSNPTPPLLKPLPGVMPTKSNSQSSSRASIV